MTSGSMAGYPMIPGLRQRVLHDIQGLTVRILKAGFETSDRPVVLLLQASPNALGAGAK